MLRFSAILFAGCASGTSFSGVYLLSLSYSNATPVTNSAQLNQNLTGVFAGIVNGTVLEVRTGYLGLCISQPSGIWVCSNNAMALAKQIKSAGGSDPLNLVWMSAKFKDEAFFQGFMLVFHFSSSKVHFRTNTRNSAVLSPSQLSPLLYFSSQPFLVGARKPMQTDPNDRSNHFLRGLFLRLLFRSFPCLPCFFF